MDKKRSRQMAKMYRGGMTLAAIGAVYGITRERVRQIIRKAGVHRDDGGAALRWPKTIENERLRRAKRALHIWTKWHLTEEEFDALVRQYGTSSSKTSRNPFVAFMRQRRSARARGIGWELTFKEWWVLWTDSGHWNDRGQGKYCMARFGDSGPYSITNIYICTGSENSKDSYLVKPAAERYKKSLENGRAARSIVANKGYTRSGNKFQVMAGRKYVGLYDTVEEARAAYLVAKGLSPDHDKRSN